MFDRVGEEEPDRYERFDVPGWRERDEARDAVSRSVEWEEEDEAEVALKEETPPAYEVEDSVVGISNDGRGTREGTMEYPYDYAYIGGDSKWRGERESPADL